MKTIGGHGGNSYKKEPRTAPQTNEPKLPSWRLSRIDFDGPWCPGAMSKECLREVIDKLGKLEGMNWTQIAGTGSHFIAIHKIEKEAQKRLVELKLDDIDELYSLRLSGKERLWGILNGNTFQALWWDPEHRICPSSLKFT